MKQEKIEVVSGYPLDGVKKEYVENLCSIATGRSDQNEGSFFETFGVGRDAEGQLVLYRGNTEEEMPKDCDSVWVAPETTKQELAWSLVALAVELVKEEV